MLFHGSFRDPPRYSAMHPTSNFAASRARAFFPSHSMLTCELVMRERTKAMLRILKRIRILKLQRRQVAEGSVKKHRGATPFF
jgi:hypothetical protein